MCAIRREALLNDEGKAPIETYLEGLNANTLMKKTMFLAEDLVLGFELIASKNKDYKNKYIKYRI